MCQTRKLARPCRAGLTLLELLIASSMLLVLAGVIGGLATAVQTSGDYTQGHAEAAQHARVALERITRNVTQATAVGDYPGFAVVYREIGSWRFPDTLVVWKPAAAPANVNGPPLVSELVIYCPHPTYPEQLLEIRAPGDDRTIPLDSTLNQSPWRETLEAIKTDAGSQRTVITNLLRVGEVVSGAVADGNRRGAVRFVQELRPSDAEVSQYRAGTRAWNDLAWPQGLYSTSTGMRQSRLRIELQLMPGDEAIRRDSTGTEAAVFLDSAALYYLLRG